MTPARRGVATLTIMVVLVVAAGGGAWLGLHRPGTSVGNPASVPSSLAASVSARPVQSGSQASSKALAKFYRQHIDWRPCQGDLQCATLLVPLDYAHPAGTTITLSMQMRPASDQAAKVGALVVNPGGPGAPATDLVENATAAFGAPLLQRFDIIGLNPRGTTGSDPVHCLTDAELDAYVAETPVPDTAAEIAAHHRWDVRMARGCEADGPIADHVSTVEAARDMDVLRAALGESRLDYLGLSYGTELGTTYADLFPHRVGRFVLDGAVDPDVSAEQSAIQQAAGFETALRSYVENCLDGSSCFLGSTMKAALAKISGLVAQVEKTPLPAGGSRVLYAGNALTGIEEALYNQGNWGVLSAGLQQAFGGNGTWLLGLSDAYAERNPSGGYSSNLLEAFTAITCLDDPWALTPAEVPAALPAFEKASPTFGASFAWAATMCSGFHEPAPPKAPPVGAPDAAPIVVIGTTRDPATPYAGAVALAHALKSGVLVTRDGDGHTGYHQGNACVDDAVNDYLVDGTVPVDGLRC